METNGHADTITIEAYAPHLAPDELHAEAAQQAAKPLPMFRTVEPGERVKAGDRDNIGTVVDDLGESCLIHFVSPEGQEATKQLPKSDLRLMNGTPLVNPPEQHFEFLGMSDFISRYPERREPIIDRLLRIGETCNIIAATKMGKSWMAADLAMSVATGTPWLKEFDTKAGAVVYIDNELHPETLADRFDKIASERGYDKDILNKNLITICLRGTGYDINSLESVLDKLEIKISLIVLDAWYRFIPPGTSENDNAEMMQLYNTLDRYAKKLNCSFLVVHHASKGEQGGKSVTDVGSGAGAMSRAADTHIVIRPHEDEGLSVINAATRSFAPLEPLTLFFTWPCWYRSTTEPKVKHGSAKDEHQKENDRAAIQKIIGEFEDDSEPFAAGDVRSRLGMNKDRATRLMKDCDRFESAGFREPKQARYSRQELFSIKIASEGDDT